MPRLARFYARLLGWPEPDIDADDVQWIAIRDPAGGTGVACQYEQFHTAPVWPGAAGEPQMMVHLEIRVEELEAGLAHAVDCGARLADYQPQHDVRVCLDPAGHPFCLWVAGQAPGDSEL